MGKLEFAERVAPIVPAILDRAFRPNIALVNSFGQLDEGDAMVLMDSRGYPRTFSSQEVGISSALAIKRGVAVIYICPSQVAIDALREIELDAYPEGRTIEAFRSYQKLLQEGNILHDRTALILSDSIAPFCGTEYLARYKTKGTGGCETLLLREYSFKDSRFYYSHCVHSADRLIMADPEETESRLSVVRRLFMLAQQKQGDSKGIFRVTRDGGPAHISSFLGPIL